MYGYSGPEAGEGINESGGEGAISLVPPSFISTARAAGGTGGGGVSVGTTPITFPVDEAGIAAYVSVGSSVDLNKTYAAYEDVVDTSATHWKGKNS